MKATFTFLLLALLSVGVAAQYSLPVTFETAEEDTCWEMFANDNGSMALADNPEDGGINTSAKVLMMEVAADASPWAGAFSDYYGEMAITDDNYMMQMMVYKSVVTNACLKLEGNGQMEIKVPNTAVNQWELLEFDFTDMIGTTFPRLTWFPDFPDTRTEGSTNYVDNIGFLGQGTSVKHVNNVLLAVFPNPAVEKITVQYPGMTAATITNIIGQRVNSMSFDMANFKEINVSDLKAGVYFITIDTADGQYSTKFIKK
ncbi:MAG: T9SS type A sorting domain-containing protein [Bacteroidota bacterium]